jgi:hypothetical protein
LVLLRRQLRTKDQVEELHGVLQRQQPPIVKIWRESLMPRRENVLMGPSDGASELYRDRGNDERPRLTAFQAAQIPTARTTTSRTTHANISTEPTAETITETRGQGD